jgi:hypothetical protein
MDSLIELSKEVEGTKIDINLKSLDKYKNNKTLMRKIPTDIL